MLRISAGTDDVARHVCEKFGIKKACFNFTTSMQKARGYRKKNLLILFDFESFLNYVHKLTILMDIFAGEGCFWTAPV
jgi:hypothetical protein